MNYLSRLFNLHLGEEDQKKVLEDIIKNISFKGANLWILACAILIASVGLNVNSTAVIIGAMLISPLMGPIVGAGFSLATYNSNLLKKCFKNLFIATVVSLLVSALYFYLSPFKDVQSELLARTSPNIYDVLIAFFGGIVGAVSITRVEKGNPIPGVAIATALMPPLCTAGFGLATFNLKFFAGAIYLYSINCFFICFATFLIIKYLKYQAVRTMDESYDKKIKYIITIIMALMLIPSFYLAYNLLNEKKYTQNIDRFIETEFDKNGYTVIYKKVNYNLSPKTIELAFLAKKFDSTEIAQLNRKLEDFGIKNTRLDIKQNSSDLKKEILNELTKQNSSLSTKDLQISNLSTQLNQYKLDDPKLVKELRILFPDIKDVAIGKLTNYSAADSTSLPIVCIYYTDVKIDESKLNNWLKERFNDPNLWIIHRETAK